MAAQNVQQLHEACWGGQIATISQLLDGGVPVNALDEYGRTPLLTAILSEQREAVTGLGVTGMTVTEAIAQAGGFGPMARKNMVRVTRVENGKPSIYKIPVEMIAEGSRPNFPMMPGDEVFVPERPW
jgi:protein involved in polysaccharide export with SLBB domain